MLEVDIQNGFDKKFTGKFTTTYKDVLPINFSFLFAEESNEYFLIIESKTQELHVKVDNVDSCKEGKDGKVWMIYSLPNAEGQSKKHNEAYEIDDKEVFVKTANALKEKLQMLSPRKQQLVKLGAFGGDPVFVKSVTTP